MSRKTRRELQDAKREYKEAKSELKTTKKRYKNVEKRETQLLKPKTADEKRYLGKKRKVRQKLAKEEMEPLKERKKVAKTKKRQAIERNGGTKTQKVGRAAHHQTSRFVDSAFQDNDVLEDITSARQNIRRSHAQIRQVKKLGNYTVKIGKGATKGIYGAGNRSYNLVRGRGFTRTPVANRWETKAKNKYQRLRARMLNSKAGKAASTTKKVAGKISKPVTTVLKNPLSAKSYLILFVGFFLVALIGSVVGGGSSTVSQNEFDLTDTWKYLSKIDREKSTDEVDYWTNIDDIMMFMGYKHEDYTLDSQYDAKDKHWWEFKHTYKELLSDLWKELNDDKDNLKTMADVYTSTNNKYLKLSKSQLKDYNEILEQAKEVGYYVTYNDLESPFTNKVSENGIEAIRIDKRFGYTSKDDLYEGSVLQAKPGQKLYAVMDGKVIIKGSDVKIRSDSAEFTYKKVSRIRVKDGDMIKTGTEVGEVSESSGQEVYYEKLKNRKKKEWVYVNVGFYLPKVEYNQTTSVISDMDIDGDIGKKIINIYNYLKKKDSAITLNGLAAMLGNFWTESSITAKRAEGDHLNPPVGASANSWDDPAWLSIDGPAIYGKYPNILHRGIGLGQWTDTADGSTRHTQLLNYAKSKKKKWYDLELQLDFMWEGDSPYYINLLKEILHSNDDVNSLTNTFLVNWEGNQGDKLKERQHNAQQVLSYLKNPPSSSGTGGGSSSLQSSFDFPPEYKNKLKSFPSAATVISSLPGNNYPFGQCTWYVANRLIEAGKGASALSSNNGNAQDWVRNLVAKGWRFSNDPVPGAVMSVQGGFDTTMIDYGHVAYVEYVNPDGTFLISECNYAGIQNKIHWAVKTNAPYFTFAIPPK